ncbi:hypothetical protein D3C80_1240170 [compost metagenome]
MGVVSSVYKQTVYGIARLLPNTEQGKFGEGVRPFRHAGFEVLAKDVPIEASPVAPPLVRQLYGFGTGHQTMARFRMAQDHVGDEHQQLADREMVSVQLTDADQILQSQLQPLAALILQETFAVDEDGALARGTAVLAPIPAVVCHDLADHMHQVVRCRPSAQIEKLDMNALGWRSPRDHQGLDSICEALNLLAIGHGFQSLKQLTMVGRDEVERHALRIDDVGAELTDQRVALKFAELAEILNDDERSVTDRQPLDFIALIPVLIVASKRQPHGSAMVGFPITCGAGEDHAVRRRSPEVL